MDRKQMLAEAAKRRKHVLRFIRSYLKKNGRPPTIAEIADEVGLRSPNATRNHLLALEEQGYLTLVSNRGIGVVAGAFPPSVAPDGWTGYLKAKIAS